MYRTPLRQDKPALSLVVSLHPTLQAGMRRGSTVGCAMVASVASALVPLHGHETCVGRCLQRGDVVINGVFNFKNFGKTRCRFKYKPGRTLEDHPRSSERHPCGLRVGVGSALTESGYHRVSKARFCTRDKAHIITPPVLTRTNHHPWTAWEQQQQLA